VQILWIGNFIWEIDVCIVIIFTIIHRCEQRVTFISWKKVSMAKVKREMKRSEA
jgi:hypothetical protein